MTLLLSNSRRIACILVFLGLCGRVGAVNNQNAVIDSLTKILNQASDTSQRVDIYLRMAEYFMASNYSLANDIVGKAISEVEILSSSKVKLNAYRRVAYIHYYNANYREAMIFLLKKLRLADSLNNIPAKAWVYNYLGNIYYLVADFEKAKHYYELCLPLYAGINDKRGEGHMYNNLGNYYESKKEFSKANESYRKALEIQLHYGSIKDQTVIYNNLGNLYYKHRADTTALQFFKKALNGLIDISEPTVHVLVYLNIGDYYLWAKKNIEAEHYLKMGYEIAQRHNLSTYLKDFSKSFGILYASKGDYVKSYSFQRKYIHYNDSLLERNNASRISFLDFQYQNERTEYQRSLQRNELKRIARVRTILLIGVTVVALSIIIVGFVLYRGNKRKDKLKQEKLEMDRDYLQKQLELKNKEIVIKTMGIFERNELIRQVVARLQSVAPEAKRSCQVELESIMGDLKARYHENVISEFEVRFKEVHEEFYNQIKESHPNLTPNDLRLCAFLKMKLSSKDIAAINHQPLNSIQMARKRLRKKMGFENTEIDLEEYISQF